MRDLCFNCPYNKGLELGNGCGNDTCIQENMLFEKDEEPVEISCWRAVMEEKERYEWNSRFDEAIKDNQTGDIVNAVEVLNQQDKRINELEEMQKAYKEISYNETLQTFELNNIKSENAQLKQQLAEKDEELKYYETLLKRQCSECKDQDKISFAIEELEKVKDWCKEYRTEDEFGVSTINVDDELNTEDNLLNFIDNQIKQLKEK